VKSIDCVWCGTPRERDDDEDVDDGLCLVCALILDVSGTLWTYTDPALAAIIDEIHQRGRMPQEDA
jgi:hypothetical protein